MDRADSPFHGSGEDLDTYKPRHGLVGQGRGCSYCGSMHPDDFMQAVRDGVEIGPTDKSYKMYVDHMHGKFYTAHLDAEQQAEFLQLAQEQKVNWGYPGYPYSRIYLPALSAQSGE